MGKVHPQPGSVLARNYSLVVLHTSSCVSAQSRRLPGGFACCEQLQLLPQPALLEGSAADAAGIELQGQPEPSWAKSTNPAPYPDGHLGFASIPSTPCPASPRPHLPVTLTEGGKTIYQKDEFMNL